MMVENEFNKLERAVLTWYKDHYQNEKLSAQIDAAKLVKREWTGHGFFVYLEVPRGLDVVDPQVLCGTRPIDGPFIKSPDIDHPGATVILWDEKGYIDCLEMFDYVDNFGEKVEDFELQYVKKPGPLLFPWIASVFRRLFGWKK